MDRDVKSILTQKDPTSGWKVCREVVSWPRMEGCKVWPYVQAGVVWMMSVPQRPACWKAWSLGWFEVKAGPYVSGEKLSNEPLPLSFASWPWDQLFSVPCVFCCTWPMPKVLKFMSLPNQTCNIWAKSVNFKTRVNCFSLSVSAYLSVCLSHTHTTIGG